MRGNLNNLCDSIDLVMLSIRGIDCTSKSMDQLYNKSAKVSNSMAKQIFKPSLILTQRRWHANLDSDFVQYVYFISGLGLFINMCKKKIFKPNIYTTF